MGAMNTSAKLQSASPCSLILGVFLVHKRKEREEPHRREEPLYEIIHAGTSTNSGALRMSEGFSPPLPTPRTLDWEDAFVFRHISSYSVSPPLPNPITARQFAQYHHHNYEGTSVITHHLFSRPRSCNSTSIQRRKNRISEQWIY